MVAKVFAGAKIHDQHMRAKAAPETQAFKKILNAGLFHTTGGRVGKCLGDQVPQAARLLKVDFCIPAHAER
jgi:hypothetical protein